MYRYLDYLPLYLRGIVELQELGTVLDDMSEERYAAARTVYDNQYIRNADADTLSRWEQLYEMQDNRSLPIDRRRDMLLAAKAAGNIVNGKAIVDYIRARTGVDVRLEVYGEQYKFAAYLATLSGAAINESEIVDMVDKSKPANMLFELRYEQGTQNAVQVASLAQRGKIFTIRQVE